MKDEYVKYGTAKLLKEKGFDEHCHMVHINNHNSLIGKVISNSELTTTHEYKFCKDQENCITIPTQQMACRWLREEHEIDIISVIRHSLKYAQESPFRDYACRVYDCEGNIVLSATKWYSRYENAVEAALEFVLTKLI